MCYSLFLSLLATGGLVHVWVFCCSCVGVMWFVCECCVVHVWVVSGSCVGLMLFMCASSVVHLCILQGGEDS